MPSNVISNGCLGLKQFISDNYTTYSKPTFILVHGGWQGPSLWTYVIPLLERAGYATYPVTLVSPDSDPPVEDFSADVEVIRRAVDTLLECGKDVILVLFSYAGYVGCEALKSFHDEQITSLQNVVDSTNLSGNRGGMSVNNGNLPLWSVKPCRGKILHIAFIASYIVAPGMTLWSPKKGECLPGMVNKVRNFLRTIADNRMSENWIDTGPRANRDNRTESCGFWTDQIVSSMICLGRLLSSGPLSSGVIPLSKFMYILPVATLSSMDRAVH
jgi:Predicted hydrolases or acyltransferases (alpha/beta hydrolase superfamily)